LEEIDGLSLSRRKSKYEKYCFSNRFAPLVTLPSYWDVTFSYGSLSALQVQLRWTHSSRIPSLL